MIWQSLCCPKVFIRNHKHKRSTSCTFISPYRKWRIMNCRSHTQIIRQRSHVSQKKQHKFSISQPLQKMEDNKLPESSQDQSIHQRSHVSQKKQNKFSMRQPLQEMEDNELSESPQYPNSFAAGTKRRGVTRGIGRL